MFTYFGLDRASGLTSAVRVLQSAMGSLDALAAVVLLMVLCSTSRVVRYYTRWVVFAVWATLSACLPIPIMLLRPLHWKNAQ